MLADKQRKAIEWCVLILRERKNPVADDFAETLRGMLTASAAPAEGREEWLDDVRRAIRAYAHACSHDKMNVCTRSDEIERLLARAALATAPVMSDGRVVAWESPSTHAILRDESPDMCDLRRRLWRALVYRDAAQTMSDASPRSNAARNLRRHREKIIQAMRMPNRGDFTVAISTVVRNMTDEIKAIDQANAGIEETS